MSLPHGGHGFSETERFSMSHYHITAVTFRLRARFLRNEEVLEYEPLPNYSSCVCSETERGDEPLVAFSPISLSFQRQAPGDRHSPCCGDIGIFY